jgi:hypothetical protein
MTDMLKLLKIVDKVEKPVMLNEAVSLNISANGDCPDDITSILGKLVNLSNPSTSTQDMTPHGGHKDTMMATIANVGDYADQAAHDYADDMGEEYANEPNPEISDVGYMTKDLAGGLNKPKKQFKKEYPGDNPMTMEEARAAELMLEYKKLIEGNPINKQKKNAAVSAVGAKNREKHYLTRMNPNQADKIRGREVTQGKDRKWHGTDNQDRMDELSKKTMGSYINKSVTDLAVNARMAAGKPGSSEENKTAIKRVAGIKRAADKLSREATDPRDSLPQTYRPNNTGYAWDKLSTRSSSNPKDSKATKSGKQLGLKHSIKGALGSHGPKGHLPEATDKKPTDDTKKKKSEKMKAYRADRDKNGED